MTRPSRTRTTMRTKPNLLTAGLTAGSLVAGVTTMALTPVLANTSHVAFATESNPLNTSSDESSTSESSTSETSTDESSTDESSTDESSTDESSTDESSTDESSTDESSTDGSSTDESSTDESSTDESSTDESSTDESSTDESSTDDSSSDDSSDISSTDSSSSDSSTTSTSDSSTTDPSATDSFFFTGFSSFGIGGGSSGGGGAGVESSDASGGQDGSTDSSADGAPADGGRLINEKGTTGLGASTAKVKREQLAETRQFNAVVNYGNSWKLPTSATGVITEAPPMGTNVALNTVMLRINNQPVVLAEGSMPMFRTLERVNTKRRDAYGNRLTLQKGDDVTQLQAYLISQGFTAKGKLVADGVFNDATTKAVKEWQKATGLPISGKVDASQMVFSPTPLRIAETLQPGATFSGVKVTDADLAAWVTTSGRDRSMFEIDKEVTVETPDGSSFTGKVISQERTTTRNGAQTWTSKIAPDEPLAAETESVAVNTTRVVVDDALVVPTGALLALSEGGYGVQVVDGSSIKVVPVEVIEVLRDRAAINGDIEVDTEVVTA